jgi:filamentous hemagglutinin
MATYKGIGFDNTNAKFRTATSADTIQFDAEIDAPTLTISGDGTIGGNLTVTGDLISRGAVNLVIQDSFIDQGVGNTGTTATAGGTTISLNADSGFTVETAQNFVAGVASTSNPTVQMSTSSSFAAGDVMVITGSTSNDGLYVVSSVATDTVTIKGIGTVAVNASTPWAQNQFVATTGDSASAYKVDLKVLAVADGTTAFKDSGGTAYSKGAYVEAYHAAATESDFSANAGYTLVGAASTTLQGAYSGGATITTSGSTDIAFTLSSGNFTASGAGAVSLTPTGASSFTSGGALTLTGGGASTWSTTSGALTITSAAACTWSTSVGNLALTGAGGLELSDGTATLDLDGSGALTDTGLVSVSLAPTGGVDFSAGAASIFDVTGGNLTLSTTTSGTLAVSSAGALDIDGVAVTIDSTGALDITAADGQALSINHGGGSALNINATGQIDLTGESASAVNIGSTGANLSLSTTTSGEIDLTSAGAVDINATGNVTIDGADVTIDAVNGFSIDAAAGASNVSVAGANLTLSTTTSGNVILDAASSNILLGNGNTADIVIDGQNGAVLVGTSGLSIVAGVSQYDVVYISASGYDQADASSASTAFAVGLAGEAGAAANGKIVTVPQATAATFTSSPSSVGQRVYLSTTAGQVTTTAPSGSGNVVFQIGFVLSTSPLGGSTYPILFQPMFIAEIS